MQSNGTLIAGEVERAAGLASLSPGVTAAVRTLSFCPNARLVCAFWPPTLIAPGPRDSNCGGPLAVPAPVSQENGQCVRWQAIRAEVTSQGSWGEVGELRMGLPAWHPHLSTRHTPDFLRVKIKVKEVPLHPES